MSTCFIYVFLVFIHIRYAVAYSGIRSIDRFNNSENGLTITAFNYIDSNIIPDWINRTFGNESVYYNKSVWEGLKRRERVSEVELSEAKNSIKKKLNVTISSHLCSIEILGFVVLGRAPFDKNYRQIEPVMGMSILSSKLGSWDCYYRAMYENARLDSHSSKVNAWATFFYCPIYNQISCNSLTNYSIMKSKLEFSVKIHILNNQVLSNTFVANMHTVPKPILDYFIDYDNLRHNFVHKNDKDVVDFRQDRSALGKLGICTSIPYTTSDIDKFEANGVMLVEWIRYYVKLGIKVFIYDRDGSNEKFIKLASSMIDNRELLVYYNFTIRGLIDPSSQGFKYDNNEIQTKPLSEAVQGKNRLQRTEYQGISQIILLLYI